MFHTFELKLKRGINDLLPLVAYSGSWGQGDYYGSNNCSIKHPDYVTFQFNCEETQEAINNEIKIKKHKNEKYIQKLKKEGRFEEIYIVKLQLQHNSLFDDNSLKSNLSISSYSLVVIDFS